MDGTFCCELNPLNSFHYIQAARSRWLASSSGNSVWNKQSNNDPFTENWIFQKWHCANAQMMILSLNAYLNHWWWRFVAVRTLLILITDEINLHAHKIVTPATNIICMPTIKHFLDLISISTLNLLNEMKNHKNSQRNQRENYDNGFQNLLQYSDFFLIKLKSLLHTPLLIGREIISRLLHANADYLFAYANSDLWPRIQMNSNQT